LTDQDIVKDRKKRPNIGWKEICAPERAEI
jgi:hypothetical protein